MLDALSDAGTSLVGLFDFDQEGVGQWNGAIGTADAEVITNPRIKCQTRKRRGSPIWAALLPIPDFRQNYASELLWSDSRLTIELLLPDSHVERFLERIPVAGDGNTTRLVARSDTQKWAVAGAVANMPAGAFAAFEPIFDLLKYVASLR